MGSGKLNTIQRMSNDVFSEIDKYSFPWKAVGLFSLTYSLGEFRTSKNWLTWSFFILWPLLLINIYIIFFEWTIDTKRLYSYMGVAQILLVVLSVFISWFANIIKFDSLNRSLRKIQLVDCYLYSIGVSVPPSKPSNLVMLSFVTMIFTFFLRLPTYDTYLRCVYSFVTYSPYVLMNMVHLLLDRTFQILFLRYQAMTNTLQKCLRLQGKKVAVLSEKMVFCYECLSSSGERLNDFFSLQILSILAAVFVISFSEVYAVLNLLSDGEALVNQKVKVIGKICWSSTTFLTIWQFGYRFSSISDKAKIFNSVLYHIMIEDKTKIVLYNEKLRAHFVMKREIVFTACGLFKLDCTLVHSMIAAATTYLVILIQFGQLSPNTTNSGTAISLPSYNETTNLTTFISTELSTSVPTRI